MDTDAQSYVSHSVDILATAEMKKKQKYGLIAEACYVSFSPFVVLVDGALGNEGVLFLCRIADRLSIGTWFIN